MTEEDEVRRRQQPYEPALLPTWLPKYYGSGIFPFKPFCTWMCYSKKQGDCDYFARREFAFILKDDVHLRYRSFKDTADFERELCTIAPHKLDLGAVYNTTPREGRGRSDFRAEEREFVMDIDLNDYDKVRSCCDGATVCQKCWKFIAMAMRILEARLREDFGYSAMLWVFSGRRGVHCWVGDAKARKLGNQARSSLGEYLNLFTEDRLELRSNVRAKQGPHPLHPMVDGVYRTAMEAEGEEEGTKLIEEMVVEQGWLASEKVILEGCQDPELRKTILQIFKLDSERNRWQALLRICDEREWAKAEEMGEHVPERPSERARRFIRWFVLYHVYPRLDINVSNSVNHLLKSPFCIHPKTGCVAVPIDPEKALLFDVSSAPRVDLLLAELREFEKGEESKENRKKLAYKHTSLAPHVELLEKFTAECMKTES